MKRIILTYTLAFSLLSAYAGEGGSPPLKNTDKSLLITHTIKMPDGGLRLMNIQIVSLPDMLM